jgi:MFS family permease
MLMAILPIWNHYGDIPIWALYGVGALCGALAPATRVGAGLIIPRATLQRRLPYINTGFAVTEQIAGILGPLVSALAIGRMGAINALWFDTVSFLFLAVILGTIPVRFCLPQATDSPDASHAANKESENKYRMHPAIIAITVLSGLFWFSYGPTEAALPLYVPRQLSGGITELSFLFAAVSVGALFGGLLTPRLASLRRTGVILAAIMLGWGALQVVFAYQHDFKIAAFIWFIAGIIWGPYFALQATYIQRRTPAEHLGKVIGLQSGILSPLMPLGAAAGGALMRVISPEQIVLLSGWMCVVGALSVVIPPWLRERDPENTFGEVGH